MDNQATGSAAEPSQQGQHAQAAMHEVEALLQRGQQGFPIVSEEISRASRALVALRNSLAGQRRSGEAPGNAAQLQQVNALLSVMASIEYPLAGVHWSRIEDVRDGLSRLIDNTLH